MGGNHGNGPAEQERAEIFSDVEREALAEVLAYEQREWKRERARERAEWERDLARMNAQNEACVAELRAKIAELLREFDKQANERIKSLRNGEPGPRCEPGPPGAVGKLPIAKVWKEGEVFYASDVVPFNGGAWQATKDTGQPPGAKFDNPGPCPGDGWVMLTTMKLPPF
jgi:hypothetical protein